MSIWMKIGLFFTGLIFKIKKMLGIGAAAPAPSALPEGGFSFELIKKAEELNDYDKYLEKAKTLTGVVKMSCGDKDALIEMKEGKLKVMKSGIEPTATVAFTESGWAAMTAGTDVKTLVMSGEIKFSGNVAPLMANMGALKLLFLSILGKLEKK
ncbi:MAG: SCP-2 sterol transfer family protein [bacterium ADurb.Bin236]|nr:MAG: SCP-2 sterol transfer family protein [bacterium ADurb.Bin236]